VGHVSPGSHDHIMGGHLLMKTFLLPLLLLTSLPAAFTSLPAGAGADTTPGRVPVVVELFTSEGCSSCPAADAVLRELAAAQSVPGVEVIALGQHVDYWNRLGWSDRFSSPAYTERQRQYAARFSSGAYTPQAVVNGQYELVGSRRAELAQLVAKAAQAPQASLRLSATASDVQVQVARVPPGTAAAEVLLLITESQLASQVGRGENAGQLLRHAAVVRRLQVLGPLAADGTFTASPALLLAADWQRPQLRAVALVQEKVSRRIVGAASIAL
jgi:hypothetical protein